MKRKHVFRIVVGLVLLVFVASVLSQIVPDRPVAVDVRGTTGATITARISVNGKTTTVEKTLPAQFEYEARTIMFEIVGPQSTPDDFIEATLRVNGVEEGSCRDIAVRLGYEGPGLFALGKKTVSCSGVSPTEIAAN